MGRPAPVLWPDVLLSTPPVYRHRHFTYGYDLLDRLLTLNAPGHPHSQSLKLGYNPNDNWVQMQTTWGSFTYGYDPLDQLTFLLTINGYHKNDSPTGV